LGLQQLEANFFFFFPLPAENLLVASVLFFSQWAGCMDHLTREEHYGLLFLNKPHLVGKVLKGVGIVMGILVVYGLGLIS
jgi:hypothetical protein